MELFERAVKGLVTYRLFYALRHNKTRGWGRVVVAIDVLRMRKDIEFQSLCPGTAHLCR